LARPASSLSPRKPPLLDLYSAGRAGPARRDRFTAAQVDHIRRTVRRVSEVMVKVTGGGRTIAGVTAHMAYVSHNEETTLEDDRGETVRGKEDLKTLVRDWHLDLTSGQYRPTKGSGPDSKSRRVKLAYNVVLSMPSPTPPEKVLAGARHFARENFGAQHRYAMALHTHQEHPHVHLVIKAEREDGRGRLRIDKARLRRWREDFAQAMRVQGIAANATPRAWRGQKKRSTLQKAYWAERDGRSSVHASQLRDIVSELNRTGAFRDQARNKLFESRKTVLSGWEGVAQTLDKQGESQLAADVRYFASQLPRVLTDRERLAKDLIEQVSHKRSEIQRDDKLRNRHADRTR
jgi:hypothetical protein